jgi:hypothetical protein
MVIYRSMRENATDCWDILVDLTLGTVASVSKTSLSCTLRLDARAIVLKAGKIVKNLVKQSHLCRW